MGKKLLNGENCRISEKESVFEFMFGLILFTLIFTAAAYIISTTLGGCLTELSEKSKAAAALSENVPGTLIIDPGHGGEDGGCSSGSILEKDLNLEVAENIFDFCTFAGIPAKMTRTEDTLLYDLYGDLSDYKGKKKVYDLKNRVKFVEKENGAYYLGIHMNKFPQSRYSGLQVYYSANDAGGKKLAEKIQSYTKEYLQNDNERQVKKASSSIYILSKIKVPAVLVECGFLSNGDELEKLKSEDYRAALALEIFCAVGECVAAEK